MNKPRGKLYWYWWFIVESQSYMEGHNKVWIFFKSLYLGFGFVKDMGE